MKYIKQISIIVFIFFIILQLFSCTSKKKPEITFASIVFSEEVHDFGKVKDGMQLEYQFMFTNKGNDTLKILDITTRCGCTAAAPDKKVFLTNEGGYIKVTFNTQGRHGRQEKDINVNTNDARNPVKKLKVIAEIE